MSNVDLRKLIRFHKKKKLVTLTAVRPPARFGFIKINNSYVNYFKEKSQVDAGWINGGFFVIEPKFIEFINNDNTFLEKTPLEKATSKKQLVAYKHYGFWQCMETVRDKIILEKALKKKRNLKKRILIIGGAGFIGFHLAKKCLKKNFLVTSLSFGKPKRKDI